MTKRSSHPLRRPAFSLIELMIAIMILGLGMVMAATVFPVSLDMTRGTVQLSLAQSAADAAVATLSLRTPRYRNLTTWNDAGNNAGGNNDYVNGFPSLAAGRVPLADVIITQGDAMINQTEAPFIGNPSQQPAVSAGYAGDAYCTLVTERSFWDAEHAISNIEIPTFATPMQNVYKTGASPAYAVYNEVPPLLLSMTLPSAARVSVVDRVYPPVDLVYDASGNLIPTAILEQVASRRYAWSAIHYRDLKTDQTNKSYFCRIVILYRGNMDASYTRQLTDATTGQPVSPTTPQPDLTVSDTLFAQPWLVQFSALLDQSGQITCTGDVAALLPEGGYFIVASSLEDSTVSGQFLPCAGTFSQILKRSVNSAGTATLQYKPGDLGVSAMQTNPSLPITKNVYAWVYPPAYNRATRVYDRNSPVIDVVRKTAIAW